MFKRCCFKLMPVTVPFSKSTVFKICRQKMCRFRVNGRPIRRIFHRFQNVPASCERSLSLRAGTPQCDEEQQQICAKLRIYIKYQHFVLLCRTSSGLLCCSYIDINVTQTQTKLKLCKLKLLLGCYVLVTLLSM